MMTDALTQLYAKQVRYIEEDTTTHSNNRKHTNKSDYSNTVQSTYAGIRGKPKQIGGIISGNADFKNFEGSYFEEILDRKKRSHTELENSSVQKPKSDLLTSNSEKIESQNGIHNLQTRLNSAPYDSQITCPPQTINSVVYSRNQSPLNQHTSPITNSENIFRSFQNSFQNTPENTTPLDNQTFKNFTLAKSQNYSNTQANNLKVQNQPKNTANNVLDETKRYSVKGGVTELYEQF